MPAPVLPRTPLSVIDRRIPSCVSDAQPVLGSRAGKHRSGRPAAASSAGRVCRRRILVDRDHVRAFLAARPIKPGPLLPAVAGGFTADDFTVDPSARTVSCPAGITRHLTAKNAVIFGVACRDCPLRERCTTAKDGRTLHLHQHDGLLRAARADRAAGPELRRDYMTHRPHVERAIAQVATWRGRRLKLRCRGVTSNHAWLKRRTAAMNLRNLLGRGLTRRDGAWVLAT